MSSLRQAIVDNARWGVANEPLIHYSQGGQRFAALRAPRTTPLHTDCSAFATLCYSWAGAPDPNGLDYSGQGFTGTLLQNLEHIPQEQLQPGDLVVFGPGAGDHVVIVVEAGSDPLTVSHGQESGPLLIRLSREAAAHRSPITCLRGEGLDDVPQEDELSAQAEQNIQELHNAMFDGPVASPGPNSVQARLARLEADSNTFHNTSNGFFATIIKLLGKDDTGLAGSVAVARRLVKAVLRRQFNLSDDDIHKIETTAT